MKNSFITELNHKPSKISRGSNIDEVRKALFKEEFYQSFPIVFLACGNYLNKQEIEELFEIKEAIDQSKKGEKLVVFKGNNKIVLAMRQLSNGVSENYLNTVASIINSIN